jgi:hypothetical protein
MNEIYVIRMGLDDKKSLVGHCEHLVGLESSASGFEGGPFVTKRKEIPGCFA